MKSQKYRVVQLIHEEDLVKNFEDPDCEWEAIIQQEYLEGAAEQAAEELYDKQTRHASSNVDDWPVTFLVADEDGCISKVIVDAAFSPTFWAQSSELNVAHLKK